MEHKYEQLFDDTSPLEFIKSTTFNLRKKLSEAVNLLLILLQKKLDKNKTDDAFNF